jgi:hypothetical protein
VNAFIISKNFFVVIYFLLKGNIITIGENSVELSSENSTEFS